MAKKWVIVLPGIMGSTLRLDGDEIWPPSLWQVLAGYKQIADLMSDDVEVGHIIYNVSVKSIYLSLLKDVEACGFQSNGEERRLIEFPYDWRRSNSRAAQQLAVRLDDESKAGLPDEITFVVHSMGGLIVRRVLEGGDYGDRSWFPKIRRLITFGTPHFGAPKIVARLQGDEKTLGVSGTDMVLLASDPRYPSSYELAGPPNTAFTLDVPVRGELPQVLDRFAEPFENALSLTAANVAAGNEFWSHLDLTHRPSDVDYVFVGGASHKTTSACATDGTGINETRTECSGDGTVPIASSIVGHVPHLYSRKEHSRVFEDRSAREALYKYLDAPAGVTPQAADDSAPVGQPGRIGLSVDKADYEVDEPIEIVVSYATPVDQPLEVFSLDLLAEDGTSQAIDTLTITLDAPDVSNFVVTIGPHLAPGVYRLTAARPTDDPAPTIFRVLA